MQKITVYYQLPLLIIIGRTSHFWSVPKSSHFWSVPKSSARLSVIARLWDLKVKGNLVQEFKGHENWVESVAFSPDGKTILTGSGDKTARLWEIGKTLEEFLKKGNFEQLSEEQKKEYRIEDWGGRLRE